MEAKMPCIIEGCKKRARHNIGIRCRRPNTRAIWAPNTEAFVCDDHATEGFEITIVLKPKTTGAIETKVKSPGGNLVTRTTKIRKKA
jgi:hypothetical protein